MTPITIQDVTNKSPQEIADHCGLPCVFCDHQATRRQRLHGVSMPNQLEGYSSTRIVEVLEYCYENNFDTTVFLSEHPDGRMMAALARFEAISPENPESDPKSLTG